jgi:16S rRNA (adenine1518-N6/adenine1519-N6)-dimethyltransferase
MRAMNLTSPAHVKNWCLDNDFHPNRTLGQNFLIDRNILEALLDAAAIAPGSRVLEVGPGLGVVTEALLARGVTVAAVEKDFRLAAWLQASLGGNPHLTLLTGDMLEQDLDALLDPRFDALISNLPYSCGTRILIDVALHPLAPARLTVMTQQEVADRLAAEAGETARSLAGVWLQRLFDVTRVRTVKPVCFWPRPEVASTIITLTRHTRHALCDAAAGRFQELTRQAFTHRRKQLGATLRRLPAPLNLPDETLPKLLESCRIDPRTRAEDLTLEQWCALAQCWPRVSRLKD